jgi:hypothetical protein
MDKTQSISIDYKTHILIGVRANGVMTVICDWPHVPTQAEVQEEIDGAPDGYVTYALCTPTSVMPAGDDAGDATSGRARFGRG